MASRAQQIAALGRRTARWNTRVQWYGQKVMGNINVGMEKRLKVCAQLLRDKVVINLSIPVMKETRKGKTVVTERSKPGEFPRADTTRLMKDIFWELRGPVVEGGQFTTAVVGTTLDYGLRLELHMNRSFLLRTLNEVSGQLGLILGSPGGGPAGPLPGQTP